MSRPSIAWGLGYLTAVIGLFLAFTMPWTGLFGDVVTGFDLLWFSREWLIVGVLYFVGMLGLARFGAYLSTSVFRQPAHIWRWLSIGALWTIVAGLVLCNARTFVWLLFMFVGLTSIWIYVGLSLTRCMLNKHGFQRWLNLALFTSCVGMLVLLKSMLEGYGSWFRVLRGYWFAWVVLLLSVALNFLSTKRKNNNAAMARHAHSH